MRYRNIVIYVLVHVVWPVLAVLSYTLQLLIFDWPRSTLIQRRARLIVHSSCSGFQNLKNIDFVWRGQHLTVLRPKNLWNVGSWGEGVKPEYPIKNLSEQRENEQQTKPTCDTGSGNRTRATLLGGERSHHYAIRCLTIRCLHDETSNKVNMAHQRWQR